MRWCAAAALCALAAAAPSAGARERVAEATVLAGPVLAGPNVLWGEGRRVTGDRVRTLVVLSREPGAQRVRRVYESSLPARSRYDSQLFADLSASVRALAVVHDLSEPCCGSVFRVRGGVLGKRFGRLSLTEGSGFVDVDGTRVAFAEDASYSNDPASEGVGGGAPESPCDEPGLPPCATISVRDLRTGARSTLTAPAGERLTQVRLAGRFVAWINERAERATLVTVWDLARGAELYSIEASAFAGEPSALDLMPDGTLAVATGSGRLFYATATEPRPHALPGRSDGRRVRLAGARAAFRTPAGELRLVTLAGRQLSVVRRGVTRDRWDYAAGRAAWASGRRIWFQVVR